MATRFYFPSTDTNAPATPAPTSAWTTTTAVTYHPLVITKTGTVRGAGTRRTKISQAAAQNRLDRIYVSDPIAAQSVSGSYNFVTVAQEQSTATDAWVQIVARIVSYDGTVERGILAAADTTTTPGGLTSDTAEISTSLRSTMKTAIPLTAVTAQDGDRLVIEVGFRAVTANAEWVDLHYGDPTGTDMALAAGSVPATTSPGWLELTQTLAWYTGPPPGGGGGPSYDPTQFLSFF